MSLRFIDLFAWIWGIRTGFESEGFECVFSNEFDQNAAKTYSVNFEAPNTTSIVDLVAEDWLPAIPQHFEVLVWWFPCQPFSVAGQRKGFDDLDRGNLLHSVVDILKKRNPDAFFLENVKHLRYHDDEKTFHKVIELLENIQWERYFVKYAVMNSKDYWNVPQNRERIYIVWFRSEEKFNKFKFPKVTPLKKNFKSLLEDKAPDKYYYNSGSTLIYPKLQTAVVRKDTIYQYRRYYVRENMSGLCPTLTANMWSGWHNVPIIKDDYGIRKLTPRECARFQGFPDSFIFPAVISDAALYKQIGNSVTIPVIRGIAKEMRIALM
jgi:DNA (cytosine-5)-methyltransferase 1